MAKVVGPKRPSTRQAKLSLPPNDLPDVVPSRALTPLEEAFCTAFVQCGGMKTRAAAMACEALNVPSEERASYDYRWATSVLRKRMVVERIQAIRQVVSETLVISLDSEVAKLDYLREVALERGDLGTAVRASEVISKALGFIGGVRASDRDRDRPAGPGLNERLGKLRAVGDSSAEPVEGAGNVIPIAARAEREA